MFKDHCLGRVNISTAEIQGRWQRRAALSVFELSVAAAAQLNGLIHQIAAIDGVMRVSAGRVGQRQRLSRLEERIGLQNFQLPASFVILNEVRDLAGSPPAIRHFRSHR